MKKHTLLFFVVISILLAHPIISVADEFEWTGSSGNDLWSDPNNWINMNVGGVSGFPGNADGAAFTTDAQTSAGNARQLSISGSSTLTIAPGIIFLDGADRAIVDNRGTITFQDSKVSSNSKVLTTNDDLVLQGGGEIVLVDDSSFLGSAISIGTLINTNNIIRGSGNMLLTVCNQSVIRAEQGVLVAGRIENENGVVEIASDSILTFEPFNFRGIFGGDIVGSPGAILEGATSYFIDATGDVYGELLVRNCSFENATNFGTIRAQRGTTRLRGVFENHETLTFQGFSISGTDERIQIIGEVTLTGGGEVVLVETADSVIVGTGSETLINVDNTIRGTGRLDARVVNQSLVRAENGNLAIFKSFQNFGSIQVPDDATMNVIADLENSGTIVVQDGGRLSTQFVDNDGGVFNVLSGGELTVHGMIDGGSVVGQPGSELTGSGSISGTFEGECCASGCGLSNGQNIGTIHIVRDSDRFSLQNTVTNENAIVYTDLASSFDEIIEVHGEVTLQGSGEIVMVNQNNSLLEGDTDSSLHNNMDHSIRGTGIINVSLTNSGKLIADSMDGPLRFIQHVTLLPTSRLVVTLDGEDFQQSGSFDFSDPVHLDGVLEMSVEQGFDANIGDSYTILNAPSIKSSTFENIELRSTAKAPFRYEIGVEYLPDSVNAEILDRILVGDVNGDGQVDLLDVAGLVAAIQSNDFIGAADINNDGFVDLLDIAPFVELLTR